MNAPSAGDFVEPPPPYLEWFEGLHVIDGFAVGRREADAFAKHSELGEQLYKAGTAYRFMVLSIDRRLYRFSCEVGDDFNGESVSVDFVCDEVADGSVTMQRCDEMMVQIRHRCTCGHELFQGIDRYVVDPTSPTGMRNEPMPPKICADMLYGLDEKTGLVVFVVGLDEDEEEPRQPKFVTIWKPLGFTPHWLAAEERP
jgi:hypothetical protein